MDPIYLAVAVIVALIFIAPLVVIGIRKRDHLKRDIKNLMPPPGQAPTEEDVVRLVRAGHKIQAIKVYREIHGTGLKESKEAVEALAAGHSPLTGDKSNSVFDSSSANEEILRLAKAGQKIEAIKRFREIHGVGLAEAKVAIEDLVSRRDSR